MKILMMTNTYRPFTGGVSRSVDTFSDEYRRMGHQVKVVAPTFENQDEGERDIFRVPAIQHFNGTDFSVQLPVSTSLATFAEKFRPDIIHSHHPFLIGSTALRLAARLEIPIVYTFHTFYERYTHYVPGGDSPALKRFAVALAAGYANLCDRVFAPSEYVREELIKRHVTKPVDVVPTGIDLKRFSEGDGQGFRRKHGIPERAFTVGFVSRLAKEKNIPFLVDCAVELFRREVDSVLCIAGTGPLESELRERFEQEDAKGKVFMVGNLEGQDLVDAYHAMDVFAFASQSETQGLVVAEAMAAGTPVVAVDAPGVGEVVADRSNGRLLPSEDKESFTSALEWMARQPQATREDFRRGALATAAGISQSKCATKALELYESARHQHRADHDHENAWDELLRVAKADWDLLVNLTKATGEAVSR